MSVFGVFYAIVRQIPAGKVATYGQIARLAGMPRCARTVGYAMAGCQDATVPCHRVVDRFGGTKACFDTPLPRYPASAAGGRGSAFRLGRDRGPGTVSVGAVRLRTLRTSEVCSPVPQSLRARFRYPGSLPSHGRLPPFPHAKSTCNPVVFLGR